jgi:hypothetical protein
MGVELMAAAVALSAIGTYNQIQTAGQASKKQDELTNKIKIEDMKKGPTASSTSKVDLLDSKRQSQMKQGFLNAIKVGSEGISNLTKQVGSMAGATGLKTKLGE